jgi:hypothetical protein
MGASLGVAVLATVSAGRSAHLLARHVSTAVALTDGYRLALLVAAGFTLASLLFAVVLLRNADPLAAARLADDVLSERGP